MVKIHTIPAMLVVPGAGNLAHILTRRIIWRDIQEEVTEATGKPEMVDTDTPCNLIATKAGVIVRTEITQGFGLVRAGDAVEAGDMLVSGMVFSDKVGYRLVHSSGRIYARTAYQLEYEVPYVQTERVRTGEEYTHRKLRLFNFHINLYLGAGERYTTYDKINKTNE